MMTASFLTHTVLTAMLFAGPSVEIPLKSGPPIGERNNRGAFFPNHVAGPGAGERRCPV